MSELLFEIGTEELPARFVPPALAQLEADFRARLERLGLPAGELQVDGTPRRLVLIARGLPERQEDRDELVLGPPARIAFDAAGALTPAGAGFARKQGADPETVQRTETEKGEYASVRKLHVGLPLSELMARELPELLAALSFPKSMRWGTSNTAFARPIHWLLALVDCEVVPFSYADCHSGDVTYGHRFTAPGRHSVRCVEEYDRAMRDGHVTWRQAERRAKILREAEALARSAGGELLRDDDLLDTVMNLTEDPTCLLGSFKADYLALPRELLVTTMKSHQKYFSVVGPNGALLPHFVVAINTRVHDPQVVARGNERVLSARLSDAEFFWSSDLEKPLDSQRERLSERVFLKGLGSLSDKVGRIVRLARRIAEQLGFADLAAVERAALLCKSDLASEMVGEFPELQGIMGREYAKKQGESAIVAEAIFEHYLPRGASDELPSGDVGAIVGLADRIDSVIGCFSLGMTVSGTQDPYALRRQVLGVMRVLLDRGYPLGLTQLFSLALDEFEASDFPKLKPRDQVLEVAMQFARDRFKHLQAEQFPVDVIDAVLEARFDHIDDALARIRALAELRTQPEFEPLAVAWKRMANITRKNPPKTTEVAPQRFVHDAEQSLHARGAEVRAQVVDYLANNDYTNALLTMIALKPVVDRFFDDVLVMDPDEQVRENRLALLAEVQSIFSDIANFTAIQT